MKKLYYLIGIIIFIISLIFDRQVSILFTSHRIGFLSTISIFINSVSGYIIFGVVLFILLLAGQKKKLIPLIIALGLYLGLAGLMKIIIARPRPFVGLNNSLVDGLNPYKSFPSGHATAVFSIIPFFDFSKILYYIWVSVAVIVSLSRVYLGVHYMSDVVAGALLGCFVGELSFYLSGRFQDMPRIRKLAVFT